MCAHTHTHIHTHTHTHTYTGDGLSISMVSNTMSENTNNIMYASVNELFSNSSLLRMNAVIVEPSSAVPAPSVMEEVEEGMEGRVGGKEDEEEEEEEVVPQVKVGVVGGWESGRVMIGGLHA